MVMLMSFKLALFRKQFLQMITINQLSKAN